MSDKISKGTSALWLTLTGCLLYGLSSGIRASYGVFLGSILQSSGVDYQSLSFILAVGQLLYGVLQPLFGVVAMKRSNAFVLSCGALMIASGLFALPFCHSFWSVMAALGVLTSGGTAAISFGVIMSALSSRLSESEAAFASGLIGASSGVAGILLPPVTQALSWAVGGIGSVAVWGGPALLLLLCIPMLCRGEERTAGVSSDSSALEMLREAWKSRTYKLIMTGFFTCGFHMIIIEAHLFTQITSFGYSRETASLVFSVYGVAAMLGCVASGALCTRMKMKNVLALLYGSRSLMVAAFLVLPKTLAVIFGFAVLLGLTGNSTVPPTSGITSRKFGAKKLAALLGVLFVAHQVGAFFSAWLGGACVTATGSYTLIWCADIVLSAIASFSCFCVKE